MSTKRQVSIITWTLLAALAGCVDGGPPSPFRRPSTRNAPTIAADGGEADSAIRDDDDAGGNTGHGGTSERESP